MKKIAIFILILCSILVYSDDAVSAVSDNMVFVEGGTFEMGSEYPNWGSQKPIHTVTVSSFYINRYETTNREIAEVFTYGINNGYIFVDSIAVKMIIEDWTIFLLDISSEFCMIENNNGILKSSPGMEDSPVVEITWYGAVVFCNLLSEMDGYEKCYDLSNFSCDFTKNGYRLPMEAEWEYAAGGGINQVVIPLNNRDEVAVFEWFGYNSGGQLNPVGKLSPNSIGLYDMQGNVREICNDIYDQEYYQNSAELNPKGPEFSMYENLRVIRGGYYLDPTWNLGICRRYQAYTVESLPQIGFRISRNCP